MRRGLSGLIRNELRRDEELVSVEIDSFSSSSDVDGARHRSGGQEGSSGTNPGP